MSKTFDVAEAMKVAQWEIAKGHLRALISIQGSHTSDDRHSGKELPYERLEKVVDDFIRQVEDNDLHR